MRLIFTGRRDHGPKEVELLRRDLHPVQVGPQEACDGLTIKMTARVATHLEGSYDLRLEFSKNEIAILARRAFGQLPFETVIDALSSERISERFVPVPIKSKRL